MKQQEVFKKIGSIIKEIKDQYDYLSQDQNGINDLELELFVANAHFLTDHAEILRKLNKQSQPALQTESQQPVKEEQKVVEPPAYNIPEPIKEDKLHIPFNPVDAPATFVALAITPESQHVEPQNLPTVTSQKQEEEQHRFFEPVSQQAEPNLPPATENFELPEHPDRHTEKHSHPLAEHINLNRQLDNDATPVPNVDLSDNGSDRESYSYIRPEPEVIRHELVVDEADLGDEAEDEVTTAPTAPAPSETIFTGPIATPPPHEEPVSKPLYERTEPVAPPQYERPIHEVPKPAAPVEERPAYQQPAPAPAEEEKVLTINQRMSAQYGQQTQSPLNTQKINDLKSAITLNDKLMFVKDLFNGYSLAYSEAIEILNRFNNFDEAERFLKSNYYTKNNWENKPGTVEKFYDLLRRRFA
jgi:hypothetical protein